MNNNVNVNDIIIPQLYSLGIVFFSCSLFICFVNLSQHQFCYSEYDTGKGCRKSSIK